MSDERMKEAKRIAERMLRLASSGLTLMIVMRDEAEMLLQAVMELERIRAAKTALEEKRAWDVLVKGE